MDLWVGRGRKTAAVALLQCPRLDNRIEFEGEQRLMRAFCELTVLLFYLAAVFPVKA